MTEHFWQWSAVIFVWLLTTVTIVMILERVGAL